MEENKNDREFWQYLVEKGYGSENNVVLKWEELCREYKEFEHEEFLRERKEKIKELRQKICIYEHEN